MDCINFKKLIKAKSSQNPNNQSLLNLQKTHLSNCSENTHKPNHLKPNFDSNITINANSKYILTNDSLQIFEAKRAFNTKDIIKAYINSPGILISPKIQKDSNAEDFFSNSEESILIINIPDYEELKEFLYPVPNYFLIDSTINAGRFIKETRQVQLCFLGQNSTWKVYNPHGIILLNICNSHVNVWTLDDKEDFSLVKLMKNRFIFVRPGQNIAISSSDLSIIFSWPYLPLTKDFLESYKHIFLLKSYINPDTPKEILPLIKKVLINQTILEDFLLLEKLTKSPNSKNSKNGIMQINDQEYQFFSRFGYTISLETNYYISYLCKCGKYINKWIFIKYLDNHNYESRCLDCMFKIPLNDEDHLLRRYKNFSYKHITENFFNSNFLYPTYENAMTKKKNHYLTKAKIFEPLKRRCIETLENKVIDEIRFINNQKFNRKKYLNKGKIKSKKISCEYINEIKDIVIRSIDRNHTMVELVKYFEAKENCEEVEKASCYDYKIRIKEEQEDRNTLTKNNHRDVNCIKDTCEKNYLVKVEKDIDEDRKLGLERKGFYDPKVEN
ncbi:hypothetical protein SteCoe_18529 [Stentor coeruleus]|uniref:Uncharacterized protein n=1 Tax=Stentor coeruleus TaxID=5963 RepID=A0A1R2BW73_9CILI|nr:hypothetical protein SteCoe_18529 [Stentor coeruleus]